MNPAGIWAGAKLGYKIGSIVQGFVKACMPQDTVVRCDAKKVVFQGGKLIAGHYAGQYFTKYT
jgi:hypothetical protein